MRGSVQGHAGPDDKEVDHAAWRIDALPVAEASVEWGSLDEPQN